MIKSNPIFEAMGNIDNEIAANAFKAAERSKRKPLKIVLISAAAVALLGIVGFTGAGNGRYVISIGNEKQFCLDVYPQEITIPEEFDYNKAQNLSFWEYVDVPLEEVFEKFGVSPLMNDNFSTENSREPLWVKDMSTGEVWYNHIENPLVATDYNSVELGYYLYNKTVDRDVYFTVTYYLGNPDTSHGVGAGKYEILRLKNGSECYIDSNYAIFAHEGVKYELACCYDYDAGETAHIDTIKQVLSDLGVL